MADYSTIARGARKKVLDMIFQAQTSHIGSNFSVIDILTVLFEKADLSKDKIILSKGWAAASFYYFLAKKGFFPEEDLDTYCKEGSRYIGLTEPSVPGVEFAGGSMQLGIATGVGFALAKKVKKEPGTIYIIASDGEMDGGIFWESLLIAAHHKLNNVVLIIDSNGLSAMGKKNSILDSGNLCKKISSFNWNILKVNGNNHKQIEKAINRKQKKPTVIVAKTVKGRPVSFMSGNNFYHYANLTERMYKKAKTELQ